MRVAINGFGRIGRCFLRAILELGASDIEVVAINTPGSIENCAHLLKYDSVHGVFGYNVEAKKNQLLVDSCVVDVSHNRDIKDLDWSKYNLDAVIECSGIFNSKDKSMAHINAGAKKVLISAPAKNADCTVIYGVNNHFLKSADQIISVGSCTTNCLAPVLHVLNQNFGVESGFMTTIHSYTNDQNVVDNNHKKDMLRARACGLSMIPTTTGATSLIGKVIPELDGKIDGAAVRVPTPNVSLVDLVFNTKSVLTKELINKAFENAKESTLNGVLDVCSKPLVSIDFNHDASSGVVDLNATRIVCQKMARVSAWYDNEWGFCARMIDMLRLL